MTIDAGTRLGPYEIVAPIGAGGMGEVYKARDTRLDRTVAVKILPGEFAADARLRLRFEREAKTISQLTHPNICTLYDVGDGYLVMELLEGESLADRLARGPLPLGEVLRYGAQVADALATAHRAGIVHRDLKPGNVMITKSGAKLLDFGLAKFGTQVVAVEELTVQRPLTAEGTIVGTFQYMAPEQLEGIEADARTDIFALGSLLYEMATGKRAFDGKTKTSLIASIVSGEPKPIRDVQPVTPPALEHVVKKCLEKDPDARWQSAHDIAEELRWIGADATAGAPSRPQSRAGWFVAAAVSLIAAAVIAYLRLRAPQPPLVYSEINPPQDATFASEAGAAALSPDGKMIVYSAWTGSAPPVLWIRSFDTPAARPLKGTESAAFPFWSPDSKSIAFFSDGKLKRIDVANGTSETIADAPTGRGGCWAPDGTIIFSPSPSDPLMAVSVNGGVVRRVTELDVSRGDTSHRFPTLLPDGRHFYAFVQGVNEAGNVILGSLDSKQTRVVGIADAAPIFVPPNIILVVRERVLRAQRVNLKTFALEEGGTPLAELIDVNGTLNFANFSASSNGLLSYVNGVSAAQSQMIFFDAAGKSLGSVGTTAEQFDPRVSPDGQTVLASVVTTGSNQDIWAYDLRRNIATRGTFSPSNEFGPAWSPDGKSLVYTSFDRRPGDLFVKRLDAAGAGELLFADKRRKVPSDWTRDGKYIIYSAQTPGSAWDIEAYSLADHKVIPLVKTAAPEMMGHVSPDGKWLAYATTDAGHFEVYVQRFPPTAERWQISGGGGTMPAWSRDGKRLFFLASDGNMMATALREEGGQFVADAPHALFGTRLVVQSGISRNQYDVTSDGRFLINTTANLPHQKPVAISLVQNWTSKVPRQ